jgi:hypothetical protein
MTVTGLELCDSFQFLQKELLEELDGRRLTHPAFTKGYSYEGSTVAACLF